MSNANGFHSQQCLVYLEECRNAGKGFLLVLYSSSIEQEDAGSEETENRYCFWHLPAKRARREKTEGACRKE